jgi:plasmid stabilization system protein ParE
VDVSKPVRTTAEADLHILELDAWWRTHRRDAVELFERELTATIRTIEAAPHVGKSYPHPDERVRRMLMRAAQNHVYYVDRDDHVLVVAVWGSVKEAGPDLSELLR